MPSCSSSSTSNSSSSESMTFTDNLITEVAACSASDNPNTAHYVLGVDWDGDLSSDMWAVYTFPDYRTIWWQYDFGEGFTTPIVRVRIIQGTGNYYFGKGEIYGSNNLIDFDLLYEFNVPRAFWGDNTFTFSNTTTYRYLRVVGLDGLSWPSNGIAFLAAFGSV
jgi:hypothetical protein